MIVIFRLFTERAFERGVTSQVHQFVVIVGMKWLAGELLHPVGDIYDVLIGRMPDACETGLIYVGLGATVTLLMTTANEARH